MPFAVDRRPLKPGEEEKLWRFVYENVVDKSLYPTLAHLIKDYHRCYLRHLYGFTEVEFHFHHRMLQNIYKTDGLKPTEILTAYRHFKVPIDADVRRILGILCDGASLRCNQSSQLQSWRNNPTLNHDTRRSARLSARRDADPPRRRRPRAPPLTGYVEVRMWRHIADYAEKMKTMALLTERFWGKMKLEGEYSYVTPTMLLDFFKQHIHRRIYFLKMNPESKAWLIHHLSLKPSRAQILWMLRVDKIFVDVGPSGYVRNWYLWKERHPTVNMLPLENYKPLKQYEPRPDFFSEKRKLIEERLKTYKGLEPDFKGIVHIPTPRMRESDFKDDSEFTEYFQFLEETKTNKLNPDASRFMEVLGIMRRVLREEKDQKACDLIQMQMETEWLQAAMQKVLDILHIMNPEHATPQLKPIVIHRSFYPDRYEERNEYDEGYAASDERFKKNEDEEIDETWINYFWFRKPVDLFKGCDEKKYWKWFHSKEARKRRAERLASLRSVKEEDVDEMAEDEEEDALGAPRVKKASRRKRSASVDSLDGIVGIVEMSTDEEDFEDEEMESDDFEEYDEMEEDVKEEKEAEGDEVEGIMEVDEKEEGVKNEKEEAEDVREEKDQKEGKVEDVKVDEHIRHDSGVEASDSEEAEDVNVVKEHEVIDISSVTAEKEEEKEQEQRMQSMSPRQESELIDVVTVSSEDELPMARRLNPEGCFENLEIQNPEEGHSSSQENYLPMVYDDNNDEEYGYHQINAYERMLYDATPMDEYRRIEGIYGVDENLYEDYEEEEEMLGEQEKQQEQEEVLYFDEMEVEEFEEVVVTSSEMSFGIQKTPEKDVPSTSTPKPILTPEVAPKSIPAKKKKEKIQKTPKAPKIVKKRTQEKEKVPKVDKTKKTAPEVAPTVSTRRSSRIAAHQREKEEEKKAKRPPITFQPRNVFNGIYTFGRIQFYLDENNIARRGVPPPKYYVYKKTVTDQSDIIKYYRTLEKPPISFEDREISFVRDGANFELKLHRKTKETIEEERGRKENKTTANRFEMLRKRRAISPIFPSSPTTSVKSRRMSSARHYSPSRGDIDEHTNVLFEKH